MTGKSTHNWVLVTGASRGIGRAIALALAADFDLVLHARTMSEALARTATEARAKGAEVVTLAFDIADREAARAALGGLLVTRKTPPWGVVCNAGVAADASFAGMTPAQWDGVIGTNLGGFYNVVQPLILPMARIRKPGRIVVMTSVAGVAGNRGQVNYSAAKAGLIGAVKALAVELAPRGITVNAVAPGPIETSMLDGADIPAMLPAIPMGRVGKPEEVAALVSFLMSEEAGYITRQVIGVNGGMI